MPKQALILLAHGSRDPAWACWVDAVADGLAQRDPSLLVACAYLELRQPDLLSAASDLLARGAHRARIVPLFFGVGQHLREHLPALVQQVQQAQPRLRLSLAAAVGGQPELIEVLVQLSAREAVEGADQIAATEGEAADT